MKPIEESIFGEPVEELKDREPFPKIRRKRAPCNAVTGQIPEAVEVLVDRSTPATSPYCVRVRAPPLVTLIFLAARGAAPACSDENQS